MSTFPELRFRQIHLDFHTSEAIKHIGADFDEAQFIGALKKGHVNSVTVFALGHHGWAYYDSKVAKQHPYLETNLLERMLTACKEADIDAPVYITVGWNEFMGREHPEWVVKNKDGSMRNMPEGYQDAKPGDARPWGWHRICTNTPYLDYLLDVTREVMEKFNPVGIFYDITGEEACYCDNCRKGMREKGYDIDNEEDVQKYAREVYQEYLSRTSEVIWSINPKARCYHNGSDKKGRDDLYKHFSHYEIESLPTAFWGYDHFPQTAAYFAKRGFDYLGMTGKFHFMWGEFGGFKHPNALKFEAARMFMMGAKLSIGDQLHPRGKMDEETYRIIGEAYKMIEEKEAWGSGVTPVADVAIICPSAVYKEEKREDAEIGASKVLLEEHILFDMIDEDADFSEYKLIILPDEVRLTEATAKKLTEYTANGGKLILSGTSGLAMGKDEFALDLGMQYKGKSSNDVDYTVITEKLAGDEMVTTPFLNQSSGHKVFADGAEVLASVQPPYFNRTYSHFCSHGFTPYSPEHTDYPAVVIKKGIVYFAHEIFKLYHENGMRLHRVLVANAIRLLLDEKDFTVSVGFPSCGRVTLMERKSENDFILHLLYGTPVKRGKAEVIEDIVPLYDVPVTIRLPKKVTNIELVPERVTIPFKEVDGGVTFTLPTLNMHEMLVLSAE